MGLTCCPERSVRNCHYSLYNNPEESSSLLLSGQGVKADGSFPHYTDHSRCGMRLCYNIRIINAGNQSNTHHANRTNYFTSLMQLHVLALI